MSDDVAVDPLSLVPLSRKKLTFVAEYLIDFNATQAALRAGYSGATSASLMADPAIKAAIDRGTAHRISRIEATQDTIITEVSALALSRIDHYEVDDNGNVVLAEGAPDNAMAAVESIDRRKTIVEDKDGGRTIRYDVKIKLYDKPGQLKLLGRHKGLFPDRVEHTGKGGGPIETVSRIEQVIVDPVKKETT